MSFDVVTIGSATVDHFADTDSELIKIDTRTSHEELIAFPLGSKLLIKELNTTTGGGGTNTAVAFSRLGLKTGFLGKIGADAAGDFVLEKLAREQVEFIGPRGGQTGFSVILNSIEDDRSILAYKGANDQLYKDDVPQLNTQWLYISSMLEDSFDTVIHIVSSNQFNVAFNPSNYQAALGYDKLKPLIDKVTLLVMNREEACKFLGLDPTAPPEMPELMQAMSKLPCRYFVITDGSRGAWVYDREHCYHGVPGKNLNICETTGAGDAFAATFTAGIIRELDIQTALNLAMTNSESVLQYKGAKEKLLTWEEISQITAQNEREIESIPLASC
ncbi:carbohydrate kinase family protein [Hahella ganghwensis]|uniref:carbohydrate kinase family protein n=1 Tax=Hahella ganghwensis TaxID=286420 RepID=UPI000381E1ED|nr:carbohydrate kinase family protein [Hahella ganghwensis]